MNIGIVGATGFLGTYLTEYFSKLGKYNIIALARDSSKAVINNIDWIIGDLCSEFTCKELIEKSDISSKC